MRIEKGAIFSSNGSGKVEVLLKIDSEYVKIKFLNTGSIRTVRASDLRKGRIKDVYSRSIANVGYIGDGRYSCSKKGNLSLWYECWVRMIKRCYNTEFREALPAYHDCTVCDEWHNFQVFSKWYEDNYPKETAENKKYRIDKDLLIPNNRTYGPEACCFLPHIINSTIAIKRDKNSTLPVGVQKNPLRPNSKFQSRLRFKGKNLWSASFNTAKEAHTEYCKRKEVCIRELANDYKETISIEAYNALMNYKVDDYN